MEAVIRIINSTGEWRSVNHMTSSSTSNWIIRSILQVNGWFYRVLQACEITRIDVLDRRFKKKNELSNCNKLHRRMRFLTHRPMSIIQWNFILWGSFFNAVCGFWNLTLLTLRKTYNTYLVYTWVALLVRNS